MTNKRIIIAQDLLPGVVTESITAFLRCIDQTQFEIGDELLLLEPHCVKKGEPLYKISDGLPKGERWVAACSMDDQYARICLTIKNKFEVGFYDVTEEQWRMLGCDELTYEKKDYIWWKQTVYKSAMNQVHKSKQRFILYEFEAKEREIIL